MLKFNKHDKLVALDESDQKIIFDFLKRGGTRIKYHYISYMDLHTLQVVKVRGAKTEKIGSLVGETAFIINNLIHLSTDFPEGMKLVEFIEKYCPAFAEQL